MIGYALQILSKERRIYLSVNQSNSIYITTSREEIEDLNDRVPCSRIVIFRKRKKHQNELYKKQFEGRNTVS